MEQTIAGLYRNLDTAQAVRVQLLNAGVDRDRIGLLSHNNDGQPDTQEQREHADKVADRGLEGAFGGAALGGIGGLVFSLTALAVPGLGPLVAAGPIVSILTGAGLGSMGGGLIGLLTGLGVQEDEAERYAEGMQRGGVLVTATVPDSLATAVRRIMEHNGLVDIQEHTTEWNNTPTTVAESQRKAPDSL